MTCKRCLRISQLQAHPFINATWLAPVYFSCTLIYHLVLVKYVLLGRGMCANGIKGRFKVALNLGCRVHIGLCKFLPVKTSISPF